MTGAGPQVVDYRTLPGVEVERLVTESLGWLARWPAQLRRDYARRLTAHPDTATLVATSPGGTPVGFCRLRYRRRRGECWVEDLYVRPGNRGAGVGAALVRRGLVEAGRQGVALVRATVEGANLPALRLAGATGFRPDGPPGPDHGRRPDGDPARAVGASGPIFLSHHLSP